MQPLIGITSDFHKSEDTFRGPAYFIGVNYIRAVEEAGGIPLVLPYSSGRKAFKELVGRIDGILITGGCFDINPAFYGERPVDKIGELNEERTRFEIAVTKIALKSDMPLLGICGGEQLITVASGGSLYQDIESQVAGVSSHEQKTPKTEPYHPVMITPGTKLHSILGCEIMNVNSTHHQSVKEVGKGFVINAKAQDGIIEGIESVDHRFVLGVQWHPEFLYQRQRELRRLFETFIRSCGILMKERQKGYAGADRQIPG